MSARIRKNKLPRSPGLLTKSVSSLLSALTSNWPTQDGDGGAFDHPTSPIISNDIPLMASRCWLVAALWALFHEVLGRQACCIERWQAAATTQPANATHSISQP